jgi:hypothetical protein
MGVDLEIIWAEFSTRLGLFVLHVLNNAHTSKSKVENSALVLSCQLNFVQGDSVTVSAYCADDHTEIIDNLNMVASP